MLNHASQPELRSAHAATVALRTRRGVTLLELLIVLLILLMITAAAVPIVAPALQNRQMREASRMVTSYLGAAKARAIETGRPVGIIIERFNGLPFAFQMSQIEVPPPYMGDTFTCVAEVESVTTPAGSLTAGRAASMFPGMQAKWFKVTMTDRQTGDSSTFNHHLVRVGDRIQFNNQGHEFVILGPDEVSGPVQPDGTVDLTGTGAILDVAYLFPTGGTAPIFPSDSLPITVAANTAMNYQILRQPVRTTTPPLVLPEGVVIDLSISGVGATLFNRAEYGTVAVGDPVPEPLVTVDPMILFSPTGRVASVTQANGQQGRASGMIFLLLGRRELMSDVTRRMTGSDLVFQNLSPIGDTANPAPPPAQNFWVGIGPQTGQVSVAEVAPHIQDYQTPSASGAMLASQALVIQLTLLGNDTLAPPRGGALDFILQSQSVGGR